MQSCWIVSVFSTKFHESSCRAHVVTHEIKNKKNFPFKEQSC